MTDEQRQEILRRMNEGMRAMSKEEMARRQLEGARNAYPELTSWQLAQASQNWWAQCRGELPVEPVRTPEPRTLWSRINWWFREGDEVIIIEPLYTHPPRQWQSLTDTDIGMLYVKWDATPGVSMADFARDVEAALKEKNT